MTLNDIKREAIKYNLTITQTKTAYVVKSKGKELARSPKAEGLAKLTDVLVNCAR